MPDDWQERARRDAERQAVKQQIRDRAEALAQAAGGNTIMYVSREEWLVLEMDRPPRLPHEQLGVPAKTFSYRTSHNYLVEIRGRVPEVRGVVDLPDYWAFIAQGGEGEAAKAYSICARTLREWLDTEKRTPEIHFEVKVEAAEGVTHDRLITIFNHKQEVGQFRVAEWVNTATLLIHLNKVLAGL